MAFLKVTKAMNALVEETSFAVVDKLMAFLDTRIEMDEDMKGLFSEFKEQLTGELKETAKAVTKSGKAAKAPGEKRAPSAYNLFIRDKMAELKEEDPTMSAQERMKAATVLWREHKEALEPSDEEPKAPKASKKATKATKAPKKAKAAEEEPAEEEPAEEEEPPKPKATKGGKKAAKEAPKKGKGGKKAAKAAEEEPAEEEPVEEEPEE
jgi:hypothetical protein